LRLIGEGRSSYVYLVRDTATNKLYALKQIRYPSGEESFAKASRKVEAYKRFANHPNIIQMIDHSFSTDEAADPTQYTVNILLPYYIRGTLQDSINAKLVGGQRLGDKTVMMLILRACKALKGIHEYRILNELEGQAISDAARATEHELEWDSDQEDRQPLVGSANHPQADIGLGDFQPFLHRDLTPAHILIDDDGKTPILAGLGAVAPSPTTVTSSSQAIVIQDEIAECSAMPYRAPELFDIKSGSIFDTKADIWSVGCIIYTCVTGRTPFEARAERIGGSLSLCVLSVDFRFPMEDYKRPKNSNPRAPKTTGNENGDALLTTPSMEVQAIVRQCLNLNPTERPDLDDLINIIETKMPRIRNLHRKAQKVGDYRLKPLFSTEDSFEKPFLIT
jgi:serine/threonine kinase 16